MSKEIDLIKCIISEIDNNLYSDFGGNPCISYTSNLKKLLLALDTPEVRHFFENYNKQSERIAELEEQLKNATHKFSIGQEVYYLDYKYKFEPYVSKYLTVCKGKILDIILREEGYVEYNFTFDDLKWIAEENCFLTKEEAEAKLKELTAKNV